MKEQYEIDLGSVIVNVLHTWQYNILSNFLEPSTCNDWYIITVTYNGRTHTGMGNTETIALQNLTAKIKLAKELV